MDPKSNGKGKQQAKATPAARTTSATLDTPFNGALQPPDSNAVNQGSLLEQASKDTSAADFSLPPEPSVSRQRIVGFSLLAIGLIAAVLLGIRLATSSSRIQNASVTAPSARIQQQNVPLETLSKQLGAELPTVSNAVTVNGQLQVTNSLVLQPSVATGPAVTGQMYYDSATNTLAYYNGKSYVSLQGGGNTYSPPKTKPASK